VEHLGKLFVRNFKPQTEKSGKENTERKKALQEAFVEQNKNLGEMQERCQKKKLSLKVTFYLNKDTPDKTSFKKDLDNMLKILMDVIKEEMDDNEKKYNLKTFDDWIKAYREGKIPKNIPLEPSRVYSKKRKKK